MSDRALEAVWSLGILCKKPVVWPDTWAHARRQRHRKGEEVLNLQISGLGSHSSVLAV